MRSPRLATGDLVSVRTHLGQNSRGPSYADPRTVDCRAEDSGRLLRKQDGTEVLSQATLFLPTSTTDQNGAPVDTLSAFAVESLVTMPRGDEIEVFTVQEHRIGGRPVYVQVDLGRGGG